MHELLLATCFLQRISVALTLTRLTFPAVGLFILILKNIPGRFAVMHAFLLGQR
jgi:hypothetical protein